MPVPPAARTVRHQCRRMTARLSTAVVLCAAVAVPAAASALPAGHASAAVPDIVPAPVSMTAGTGEFTLTPQTRIAVTPASAAAIGDDLAAYLRPATGYPLPVVTGTANPGDIAVVLGNPGTLTASEQAEGYQLDTTTSGATVEAVTAHGLYNGIQTLRQLLPAWASSPHVTQGPWALPVVTVTDYPRYAYRGLMVDIARHYEPPAAVAQLIDQAAAYKINVLHLHLGDDQGFRVAINGFPRLTSTGGQGSVGTGGRAMDPGGWWTQAQYQAVVADAAAHFMTVVPEVDTPGHDNAVIMSEFSDTANPLLNGHPQDINCGAHNPPQWDYTGDVGYSALCPASSNTWAILTAIIQQLSALSPGPYYDMGGDEVPAALLSQSQYAAVVDHEAGIVTAQHKTLMGWADIAGQGTAPPAGSVAEYWDTASGSQPGTATATEAVAKGMQVVMAPANHTYLDQKYIVTGSKQVPPALGLTWACPTGCDVSAAYGWDPGSLVTGVTGQNVTGVEGAIWGETTRTISNVDYLVFPRLLALAEVAWSPDAVRTPTSPAYQDFLRRLAGQGARLMAAGVNFYPSTQVAWPLDAVGTTVTEDPQGQVNGTVATLSAPGFATKSIGCTVDWGDGTATAGAVHGTNATGSRVNGLYTITGQHTYAQPGTYRGVVTVTTHGAATAQADFTAVAG